MSATPPLNPNLRSDLPDTLIPWAISPETFAKMPAPTKDIPYRAAQLFPTDPEWAFVWHHFHHQKPTKYSLGKVLIVHDRHQQQAFENHLSAQEREAPKFLPTWDQEPRAPQRAQAIQRWKDTTAQFSPFESMETDGRRRSWKATKILPLFHGTKKENAHSICESGHTFFGKKSLSKNPGDPHSTDDGYFGSGIYFTNSARYAADIYSQGHLLISWVSMREPFPFVGDPDQQDMTKLRGKGAYKHYNAHYAPVNSLNPANPNCPEYHPTQQGQIPTYDEYVVFQKSQTLPRFWIHLTVDALFVKTLSSTPKHVEDLIPHLMTLLQNPHVDTDKKLRKHLNEKLTFLLKQEPEEYLEELQLDTFYNTIKTLLDPTGKVNRAAAKALMGGSSSALPVQAAEAAPAAKSPPNYDQELAQALAESLKTAPKPAPAVKPIAKAQASSLPAQAFGALKWEQYFGLKVIEPKLPPDIDKILQGPCPIFPGKKVAETHFLKLIPEDMTLERLESLTQNPREGNKMGFRDKGPKTWAQHAKTPSGRAHWVLMTNDVIPGSRSKSWKDQQTLAATFKGQGYELLSGVDAATCLLLEYVETERRFYADSPWTWTRCVEQVKVGSSQWPLAIGGFAPGGAIVDYSDYVDSDDSRGVGVARKFL